MHSSIIIINHDLFYSIFLSFEYMYYLIKICLSFYFIFDLFFYTYYNSFYFELNSFCGCYLY